MAGCNGKSERRSAVVYAVVACLGLMMVGVASAATHTVGDSTGWIVPTTPSFYSTWAAKQTFKVGDVLEFKFTTGTHTVAEVSKSDYDSCTATNPISTKTTGPASMTITSGSHYYICTIPGHCSGGQKLAVSTTGSSSTPSSSPTGSPAPSSDSGSPGTDSPSSSAAEPTPSSAPIVTATTAAAGGFMMLVVGAFLG